MKISQKIKKDFISLLEKKYQHREIVNSSLVPVNDPSVLFTTAGMQPLVPYLLGEKHPLGKRVVNIQRCFRTVDIDEVGDTIHHTFFEMLGYWSLGDYFKELSLEITFDFFVNTMKFDPNRLYATVFVGNEDVGKDMIAINKWKSLYSSVGIDAEVWDGRTFTEKTRIFPLNKKENWWGPAGETGPCGSDSEFFYWRGKSKPDFHKFVPWDSSNMFIEISNNVFLEFDQDDQRKLQPLKLKSVDFGSGFERVVLIKQLKQEDGYLDIKYSVYDTELFDEQRQLIESKTKYTLQGNDTEKIKSLRIILDHIRASTFLIADGVIPSNKDQGYILRRLIRRVVRHLRNIDVDNSYIIDLSLSFLKVYSKQYKHLKGKEDLVTTILSNETEKFNSTLDKGLEILNKLQKTNDSITGKELFMLYESYGFPCELSLEILKLDSNSQQVVLEEFDQLMLKHRELSRSKSQDRFKGGLINDSYDTVRLHTLQHVFLKFLQTSISSDIHQKGSNITPDRFRLDVNLEDRLTEDQMQDIEQKINEFLKNDFPVKRIDLKKTIAEKIGAEHEFGQKYPDMVSIYFIGLKDRIKADEIKPGDYFSAEFCGGPHVENINEILNLNEVVQIQKQERIGNGILRFKVSIVKGKQIS